MALGLMFYAVQFLEKITINYKADAKDVIQKDVIQLVITIIFGLITAGFSYYAYNFSKEKFRLDLVEKRWVIYEEVLKFCSTILVDGGLPAYSDAPEDQQRNERVIEAHKSAQNSFRGLGYHKTKSLFGKDIQEYFKKLDDSYCWLAVNNKAIESGNTDEWLKHINFIKESADKLPDLFKPYVYFGDF